jgi:hypothetical protein
VTILESPRVQELARIVEESTRSTKEGVKYFIEPAPGTLARAKNKRHHIIFGRRGSGKSSLLAKVTADHTVNRSPIAYVDLEEFKGHSYPDVLLSVLIKTLNEFKIWMATAAVNPANKTSFWAKLFGATPKKKGFNRTKSKEIADELVLMIQELNGSLFAADEAKETVTKRIESANELTTALSSGFKVENVASMEGKISAASKDASSSQKQIEYSSKR